MNFIQQLETDFADAEATVKAWLADAGDYAKSLAAKLWADIKAGASSVAGVTESTIITQAKAALPTFLAAAQNLAGAIVADVAKTFSGAPGTWLQGIASAQLWQTLKSGLSGFAPLAISFSQGVIETLIQSAYAAFTAQAAAAS